MRLAVSRRRAYTNISDAIGRTKRNGRTSSGSQRWRCTACGASTTVRYDDTATRLDEFLGWLLSKDSQAAMPGGGRSFGRRTAEFWVEGYLDWCGFRVDFLEDRTVVNGRRVNTHERLRRARSSLRCSSN